MLRLEDVVAYLVTRNCSETLIIEKQTGLPEFLKEFCAQSFFLYFENLFFSFFFALAELYVTFLPMSNSKTIIHLIHFLQTTKYFANTLSFHHFTISIASRNVFGGFACSTFIEKYISVAVAAMVNSVLMGFFPSQSYTFM